MCISNTKAEMTGTKILVAPVLEGDSCRQLTVYTNQMELAKTKSGKPAHTPAMILPIPAGPVEMIDLSAFAGIFDELNQAFPRPMPKKKESSSQVSQ